MLSNTAVPKYYGEFRGKVLRGEIPVCKELSMEMNRIDALIDDPDMYYDDEAIDGCIRFSLLPMGRMSSFSIRSNSGASSYGDGIGSLNARSTSRTRMGSVGTMRRNWSRSD